MSGVLTLPAPLDPHVHLRDLAWAHKGTFTSETAAALAGGYWAVLDMPNTPPPTVDPQALVTKLAALTAGALCDWGVYFGASQDDNTACYPQVARQVCGLKMYNNATTGTLLLANQAAREAHFRAWPAGRVIAVHAEGQTVADILALVRLTRKHTHFCHISTAEEIALLRAAKADGLPVSVGVTPHHLFLTERDVMTLGALGRMKPELKTAADQAALWEAIADGTVDVVESDHAPHTLDEKRGDPPPSGVPGLETTLPLLLTAVREGRLSLERMIALVTTNPRRIFGLQAPPETYTEIDLDASYVISREGLHTACGWSPFEGMRVWGRVRRVIIRGQTAFADGRVCVSPGFGHNLFAEGI
jgi:carbamoyl-phosphate synthase/aspartate carbamoyltransferase/dihydroorotase